MLITPRLILRDFREDDFAAVRAWEERPEVRRYEHHAPTPEQTREQLRWLVEHAGQSPRTSYRLAITLPGDDTPRGRISLKINWEEIREWEIGWTLHPDHWGRGYASEAARAMLELAFTQLNAHRVVAYCNVNNAASVGVMQRIGMRQDARLRETRWWNGAWADEYVYAILERDWGQAPISDPKARAGKPPTGAIPPR
ncbi:MAG TPA: GNAT family protein [Anaerolineaceae bacterium]|nr:GNAT family protein [Anaerolineaceae bacterium]